MYTPSVQPPFAITIHYPPPPISVNNIVHNGPHIDMNANQTNQQTTVHHESKKIFADKKNHGQNDQSSLLSFGYDFLKRYYTYAIGCGLLITLAGLLYYLHTIEKFLRDHMHNWCLWRLDEYENNVNAPPEHLQEELVHAIQLRYYNHQEPLNHQGCITRFSTQILQEIEILERYIYVCTAIENMHLPFVKTSRNRADKALANATLLKNRFLYWCIQKQAQQFSKSAIL